MYTKPLLLSFFIMLTGCAQIKQKIEGPNDADPLVNNIVWQVTSFKGNTLQAAGFPNGMPTITFYMHDGKIGGNDGCNNFMGLASYHGHHIKTGPLATTKMACAPNGIQQAFYTILASPQLMYQLDGQGTLRLYINDAEVMALKEKL